MLAAAGAILSMRYAAGRLETLRRDAGHSSAETAMRELMAASYPGARVEIVGSGSEGPGLRYVVAEVRPAETSGNPARDRIEEGCYFLRVEQGWVHLSADEFSGPAMAVGKVLLDHLQPGRLREGTP
jgi:hypothetical protein